MFFIFIAAVVYLALAFFLSTNLLILSVPVFLGLVYLLPPAFNLLLQKVSAKNKKLLFSLILPSLASIFYLGFAHLVMSSGLWEQFVQLNTRADSQMSIEITQNLLDSTQFIFVGLVYYGSSLGYYLLEKRKGTATNKGVQHA